MIRTNIPSLSRPSGLSVWARSGTVRVWGSTIGADREKPGREFAVGVRRGGQVERPILELGSLATSDSETLAETQTERRSASMKRTSLGSALWLGTAIFHDDRAVEGSDDLVEASRLRRGRACWPCRHGSSRSWMFSETPRIRSRWAASTTAASAWPNLLVGQPFFLSGVEPDLFDRGLELGLDSLASVPGHEAGCSPTMFWLRRLAVFCSSWLAISNSA